MNGLEKQAAVIGEILNAAYEFSRITIQTNYGKNAVAVSFIKEDAQDLLEILDPIKDLEPHYWSSNIDRSDVKNWTIILTETNDHLDQEIFDLIIEFIKKLRR